MTDESGPQRRTYHQVQVEGYYRYHDIRFGWYRTMPAVQIEADASDRPKSLPDEECRQPITSFFHQEALVHPDHPLHLGAEGIELFLGQ